MVQFQLTSEGPTAGTTAEFNLLPEKETPLSSSASSGPLVTIGLAVYNGERHLVKSIESLLNQTFEDFVLLISDNASTDKTEDICRGFAGGDSRIRYHRNPTNIGMAGNYNLLFGMSASRYFRWATADDYTGIDMLADAVEVMEADSSLALCYPRALFVDAEGREIGPWEDKLHLLQDNPLERFRDVVRHIGKVHHHMGLMRSSFVRRSGLMSKHVSSDVGFIAELSLWGKFSQIPKYQFFRRIHENSSSWATNDEAHQARLYHAATVNRIPFSAFRFHWRFVEAVDRSPLSMRDKARAYAFLLREAWWDRRRLGQELVKDSRRPARMATVPKGKGRALANRNHS